MENDEPSLKSALKNSGTDFKSAPEWDQSAAVLSSQTFQYLLMHNLVVEHDQMI